MGNAIAQELEDTLSPVVGLVLARVTVELESQRIGKNVDTLVFSDLSTIADNLSVQLKLLVGAEVAEEASRRVRALRRISVPFM